MRRVFHDAYAIKFSDVLLKSFVVGTGTRLNCLNLPRERIQNCLYIQPILMRSSVLQVVKIIKGNSK